MPKEFYEIPQTEDVETLRRELNRILDDISRRLNFMKPDGENVDFGSKRIINLAAATINSDAPRLDQVLSLNNLISVILGTTNQITVTDNGDETITLSTPQNIHTGATPSFAGFTKIGGASDYMSVEADGTILLTGAATAFDDLQVSISNVRVPVSNSPTERLYDHGISGGVTFPSLGFAVGDYMYFDLQTSHSMKLSSVLDHHFHYMTPTDGTGDKFKFQLDVIVAPIGGSWVAPTGTPFTTEVSMSSDLSNAHALEDIADVPASNTTVSTIYKCKLTRIAASADEYAGEVYIEFVDSHYEKDTIGSRMETSK